MTTYCCDTPPPDRPAAHARCPTCGAPGKLVPRTTLQSLLTIDLRQLHEGGYRFCGTAECPVAYFAGDGAHAMTVDQVRVPIWQKKPAATTPVCYCFKLTPGMIEAELLQTGTSTVVDQVTAGIKARQCACELTNPQGSCCLGNVRAAVRQMSERVGGSWIDRQLEPDRSNALPFMSKEESMTTLESARIDALAAQLCTDSAIGANLSAPLLRLLAHGAPVTVDDLARASEQSPDLVVDWLRQGSSIEWDAEGRIVGAGLTLKPTPHQFVVAGRVLYTWCALDTLIFPIVLGQPAQVVSTVPGTGALVQLTVTPDGVQDLDPPTAVMSLVATCDADIRSAFCSHVHFFREPAEAAAWLQEHPEGQLVSVADAFAVAKRLAACLDTQGCCGN